MPLPTSPFAPVRADDFADEAAGTAHWKQAVDELLVAAQNDLKRRAQAIPRFQPQFLPGPDPTPGLRTVEVPLLWNAFPKSLLSRFGRARALAIADTLVPEARANDIHFDPLGVAGQADMRQATRWVRQQNEYCEWRVERDPATGRIQRVVFTVELQAYWQSLHDSAPADAQGVRAHPAARYASLLGAQVQPADLLNQDPQQRGEYDPLNRWNTTHGIVHLSHPSNGLDAALVLLAASTLPVAPPQGARVTQPEALTCSLGGSDPNRHSDPTIVGTVNALARRGCTLAVASPLLTIHDVDTQGWALPDGTPGHACLRPRNWPQGGVQRLVVEAPKGCKHQLDALTIGGEPLLHGGQIAECITVRLLLACTLAGRTAAAPVAPSARGMLMRWHPAVLRVVGDNQQPGAGWTPAFEPPPPAAAAAAQGGATPTP